MTKEWRGINDFYFVKGKKEEKGPAIVDMDEPDEQQTEDEVEVRLSDPKFIKPDEGYQPNKPCKMQVSAEFLEETSRKRVTFDVYSSYKGKEVKEYSALEGFVKDGIAVAEIKYLPLNEDYAHDYDKSEDVTYEIRFVASHTKGEKPVESGVLELPESGGFKTVLEIEDVLFNLNSAVMMPDIPDSTSSNQGADDEKGLAIFNLQAKATGLFVLRAIFRFIEDNPDKLLLIAGHTDTSGGAAYNFELSEQRANNVLHLLTGDGDAWAALCEEKHQVEDYQQILKHYSRLLLWPCDPGKIDNAIGKITRTAVKAFQQIYNAKREEMGFDGGDIPVQAPSGDSLDKETWRAFYNLYMWETAIITLGEQETTNLSQYRDKIQFVDDNKKILACGESFPLDQKNKSNYKSQKNRRVEMLFFDQEEEPDTGAIPPPGSEPYTTEDVPFYDDTEYTNDYIAVNAPKFLPTLDLQSVDLLGHPVQNASLVITCENEELESPYSKEVTTDSNAFVRIFGVPVGTIEIKDSENNLLKIIVKGEEKDAILEAREAMPGILSVIVKEVSEDLKRKHKKQLETYSTVPTDSSSKLYPPSIREKTVQDFVQVERKVRILAVDNLIMAAGFDSDNKLNTKKLASDIIKTWLQDYYPVITSRDFILFYFYSANDSYKISVLNSQGDLIDTFNCIYSLSALIGAYAVFESLKSTLFVDMINHKYIIAVDKGNKTYSINEIIREDERDRFADIVNAHSNKIQISYYCRSVSGYAAAALIGGTGYLESYGESSGTLNNNIHDRNVAVAKAHSIVYKIYINGYIDKVEACKDEKELRKLGPPMRGYNYPAPTNATNNQITDIVDADSTGFDELKSWKAISSKINEFTGRRASGFYILAKYSVTTEVNELQKVQFEYNFTLDSDGKKLHKLDKKIITGFTGKIDTKVTKKITKKKIEAGIEHELNLETGEGKVKGTLKIGKYGFEIANDGSLKCTNGPLVSEVNPEEKTFGTGLELDVGDNQKVYFGIHFQGLREDTVLAYVSNAPGFFDRRPHGELLSQSTKWNDLNYNEQLKLEDLGFTMKFWDDKHNHPIKDFPGSASKKYNELSAKEQIAIVHLGFNSTTWPKLIKDTAKK